MGEQVKSLDGVVWIIDPIDGTMNFVKQHRHFMISIGIFVNGVGKLGYIFDVMREDLFNAIDGQGAWYNDSPLRKLQSVTMEESVIGINAHWVAPNRHIHHEKVIDMVRKVRGTRSYGSAAMEIAFVVSGKLDAYVSMRLAPWDIAGVPSLLRKLEQLLQIYMVRALISFIRIRLLSPIRLFIKNY